LAVTDWARNGKAADVDEVISDDPASTQRCMPRRDSGNAVIGR
jgi:hypothetical protein